MEFTFYLTNGESVVSEGKTIASAFESTGYTENVLDMTVGGEDDSLEWDAEDKTWIAKP